MSNSYEWSYNLNPFNPNDASLDNDEDGLTNLQESHSGTNPFLQDSDYDKMPDKWEIENQLDPLVKNASEDLDLDGLSNLEEYFAGTDPNNSLSKLNLGDINGDNAINIKDAIIVLKICTEIDIIETLYPTTFLNEKIYLSDVINILLITAEK